MEKDLMIEKVHDIEGKETAIVLDIAGTHQWMFDEDKYEELYNGRDTIRDFQIDSAGAT
ncbi:MAG: hypothetical protein QME83_04665 [Thermodesulfobacteriota bacterium]|nr:hypothetical protein [Thermodesulfobacteriota bacterium]